ncbi:putative inactive purple acid phosphatase 24 [Nymphaea thermarum]|nr:putative inactive purple acid phosphatase 24 [Nymphaea thermarum]
MKDKIWILLFLWSLVGFMGSSEARMSGEQPLSKIAIHKAMLALDESAHIKASPLVLGLKGENMEWVTLKFSYPNASVDDWIGVFSPSNFSAAICEPVNKRDQAPLLCTAPVKYQYANYSNPSYTNTGIGVLKLLLINQRADFSFALFSGGISKKLDSGSDFKPQPKLIAVSNTITFANPKAPVYPRLAQGKSWNEFSVAIFSSQLLFLIFRDRYTYRLGHRLFNNSYIWSQAYHFRASPYPGQESVQHVIIFGDMGKAERDGSNEYSNYQPGCLNTTDQLIKDLRNIDIVFHIGDLSYANGYLSQWDQFTSQIEPIASTVPYMVASGNHERDWPGTGSFYANMDSGGECGVLAETMFYAPAENRAKFWYSTDYGMFHFCVADTEHDWRPGTEQYKFIEHCLATADRQKQPWLIFVAHRVLGYSSNSWYAQEGSFEEPMGRESLQGLWQKYKVDLAFYGHVHNYERTCPIYESICMSSEKSHYTGPLNGTIHVVVGGGGSHLSDFTTLQTSWSLYKDYDFGFVKLTAFNHSSLLFEYKKSRDGKVYDSFTINRDYRDILTCTVDSCPRTTMAS